MLTLLLALTAHADPTTDPYDALRTRTLRVAGVDQLVGSPATLSEDATRWRATLDTPPEWAGPELSTALAHLRGRLAPELAAQDDPSLSNLIWAVRPEIWGTGGDLVPVYIDGDPERGMASARGAIDAFAYAGPLETRLRVRADLDLAPTSGTAALEQWRLGIRTPGFAFAFTRESRWYGPARHSSLLYTDNARPLPGLELHGDWRWPGALDMLGRFGGDLVVGLVPGERHDLQSPAFLLLDLRWQPHPVFEFGISRNSMFGGWVDGELRDIDVGHLILPVEPHIYDDTAKELFDTDERLSADARLNIPIRRIAHALGGNAPVDYLELYIIHGGEDTAGTYLIPRLAGAANVYGVEVAAGPAVATLERVIVADDYQRWYRGHRLYHEGWMVDDRVIGNAWGGDSSSWWVQAGVVGLGNWTILTSFEQSKKYLVADLAQDTLFVFPHQEIRHIGGLRGAYMLERGGWLGAEAQFSTLKNEDYLGGQDRMPWRVMLRWEAPTLTAR